MSNPGILTVAAVTALLKSLLDNMLVRQLANASIGDVMVTALPPDRIQLGTEERTQLNLYLYRITPNSARYRSGVVGSRADSALLIPLALDLHYLISAYGERELQAEVLLGCALQCFHEHRTLSQEQLRTILTSLASAHSRGGPNPILELLTDVALVEQLRTLTITPEFLNMEDVARLWSSLQAHARLSMTYQASVAFISSNSAIPSLFDTLQVTSR